VIEAIVPYSAPALVDFLRAKPEKHCGPRTARAMAMAAYERAVKLREGEAGAAWPVVGVSCTASLASDRQKRGPHRLHVAWQSSGATVCYSVELIKQRRDRAGEEHVAAAVILNALAEASDLSERASSGLQTDEPMTEQRATAAPSWQALLAGTADAVCIRRGVVETNAAKPLAIFPGAFNPLHPGHRKMVEVAEQRTGHEVEVELSIENVDKPPLDYWEIQQRTTQFRDRTLWLTRAARFRRKAELFPRATFVVGIDTIRRIADPRYYNGQSPLAAIEHIAALGCRFLVFGRLENGSFITLDKLPLPDELRAICDRVSEAEFREDVSSTTLRREAES
jgi:nicotinic acid mononucleotide adenylyltransferase